MQKNCVEESEHSCHFIWKNEATLLVESRLWVKNNTLNVQHMNY